MDHQPDNYSSGQSVSSGIDDVMFICSKCKQVLKLDKSYGDVNSQNYADLINNARFVANIKKSKKPSSEQEQSSSSEDIPPSEQQVLSSDSEKRSQVSSENNGHDFGTSFTMIGDTNESQMNSFNHKLKTVIRLFDILAVDTSLDYPLCEECNHQLLDQLDNEMKEAEKQHNLYKEYYKQISANKIANEEEFEKLRKELDNFRDEEEVLMRELKQTEEDRSKIKREVEELEKQERELLEEEKTRLIEYAELRVEQVELDSEQKSAENHLHEIDQQLKMLKKTNVFNITFHIWHHGPFGTINGFRLGRLPSENVEWSEVNAAWGQTTLLLASLLRKMDITLDHYKLVPFGNHSYIETLEDKPKELPLYTGGGIRLLFDSKFDQAMVAFLECLLQFQERIEKLQKGFTFPYKMDKGKMIDSSCDVSYSIKLQFNSEEDWTKALKFMLTNLKWGLAWVCSSENASKT